MAQQNKKNPSGKKPTSRTAARQADLEWERRKSQRFRVQRIFVILLVLAVLVGTVASIFAGVVV